MSEQRIYRAIGLMSGTSLDGIDAAYVETDGERIIARGPGLTVPYTEAQRSRLRDAMTTGDRMRPETVAGVERDLTDCHAEAVHALLARMGRGSETVDVVGFHGQTLRHAPDAGWTWQIGDGRRLADRTGIAVVNDFRAADVAAGGQGAPLVPLYHAALARELSGVVAVLNLGGVANVTYLGPQILAFDTGPANAPINDWLERTMGAAFDADGALAASGQADFDLVAAWMKHPYFARRPPKSLDRDGFDLTAVDRLSPADGAATLLAFAVAAIAHAAADFSPRPDRWIVCGGGRHNRAFMAALSERLPGTVEPAEAVAWAGDFVEAEAFGYLAVRSLKGLALTMPGTTGVPAPTTGGVLHARPLDASAA